jgi:hypothetical protein
VEKYDRDGQATYDDMAHALIETGRPLMTIWLMHL